MPRLPVSFQMTWFGTGSFDSEMGSDRRLMLWNLETEPKACERKLICILQSNNWLIPRCPRNTISGNNIGSKGHWREPDLILGTKLHYKYGKYTLNCLYVLCTVQCVNAKIHWPRSHACFDCMVKPHCSNFRFIAASFHCLNSPDFFSATDGPSNFFKDDYVALGWLILLQNSILVYSTAQPSCFPCF